MLWMVKVVYSHLHMDNWYRYNQEAVNDYNDQLTHQLVIEKRFINIQNWHLLQNSISHRCVIKWHNKQGIHRHQIPPRYHNAASGSRFKVQLTHITIWPTTAKCVFIHETGSTLCITMPPKQDRATTTGDLDTKFHDNWYSGSRDMLAERQTHSK